MLVRLLDQPHRSSSVQFTQDGMQDAVIVGHGYNERNLSGGGPLQSCPPPHHLTDDFDNLAGLRIDDHPVFVDHRVAIFLVARDGV